MQLNEGVSAFSRNYVSEIRRMEEMERRLRFFAGEIEKEKLPVPADYNIPAAPNQKDLIDLEVSFLIKLKFHLFYSSVNTKVSEFLNFF